MQREIRTLRQESTKVKELENENQTLRSKLEQLLKDPNQDPKTSSESKGLNPGVLNVGDFNDSACTAPDENVHHKVLEELRIFKEDYGKLAVSHRILLKKYSLIRESFKEWGPQYQAQYQEFVRKHKKYRSLSTIPVSTTIFNTENEEKPKAAIISVPSPRSSGDNLSSSSVVSANTTGLSSHGNSRVHSSGKKALPPVRDVFDIPPDSDADNLAETCDESEPNFVPEPPSINLPVDAVAQEVKPSLLDEDSDSPVVVSERFLKRKRALVSKPNNPRLQFVSAGSGNLQKPIRIKSDPDSSSPMAPVSYLAPKDPQDSVDLDEVGDKHFTPRKRRRLLEELRLQSSGENMMVAVGDEKDIGYPGLDDQNARMSQGLIFDELDGAPSQSPVRDKAFFMEQGQAYGIRIWEQEQRDLARRRELDSKIPDGLRKCRNGQGTGENKSNQDGGAQGELLHPETKMLVSSQFDSIKATSSTATPKLRTAENVHQFTTPLPSTNFQQFQQSSLSPQMLDASDKAEKIQHNVLRTTDPNAQFFPRTSQFSISRRRALPPIRKDPASTRIHILAEDGEEFSEVGPSSKATRAKQINFNDEYKAYKAPDSHRRLGDLLASSPQKRLSLSNNHTEKLVKPVTVTAIASKSASRPNDCKNPVTPMDKSALTSNLRNSREKSTRPKSRSRTETRPLSSWPTRTKDPNEVLPEHEPLRIRSVNTLGPDDFKLNPAHNHGYDHPFSEVVRNRDLRKCMPGCTRPGCCGSTLRKVVEIGGYTAPRTSGLLNSSPADESEADQQLLEEYLGENKSRLKGMLDKERNELLLQAKTERFANVHGKHRYEFGRAPSPPGFWEPDMPTTQQEKENRAAALVLEREKVAEMYKEAMRPKGRYKFRDE